jgi:hypothetical protein
MLFGLSDFNTPPLWNVLRLLEVLARRLESALGTATILNEITLHSKCRIL